jgi:molybdopterin molybdotransferase
VRAVEVEAAHRIVLAATRPSPAESVPLDQALGRVLAEDVRAAADVPGFSSSAMDGFAVRAADTAAGGEEQPVRLRLVGESRAGRPARQALAAGEAIAISTGAEIPAGADAVVRLERARREAPKIVAVQVPVAPGTDVRGPGSDVKAGTVLQRHGTRLGATGVGGLAALGRTAVGCHAAPAVSVIATGDELQPAGALLGHGQLHDSNSYVLAGLVRAAGATVVRRETVADDARATRELIVQAVSDADVLVLSGGVSLGAHDHVRPSLEALGATCGFWGINMRPGAPTWFGVLDGTLVFALPGSPVAAIATFALLVAPALAALQGLTPPGPLMARLDGGHAKRNGRAHAVPCRLELRRDGLHARPTRAAGAQGLSAVLEADCVALVPAAAELLPDSAEVPVALIPQLGGIGALGGSAA